MKEMICIICPNGCKLIVDELNRTVKGNRCRRGKDYGIEELIAPKRSFTSTIKTIFPDMPALSVKTTQNIDKKYLLDCSKVLKDMIIDKRLPIGSIIVKNIFNTGIDLITTTDMMKED